MKNKLLLILALVASEFTFSQPILTFENASPVIGSVITYQEVIGGAEDFLLNITGENCVWDFSGFVTTSPFELGIYAPENSAYSQHFPEADCYFSHPGNVHDFQKISEQSIARVGVYWSFFGLMVYSDYEMMMSFPFTYNSEFSDIFQASIEMSDPTYERVGEVVVTADGYGTLVLPWGSISNVLRVNSVATYIDSNEDFEIPDTLTNHLYYHPGALSFVAGANSAGVFTFMDEGMVNLIENVGPDALSFAYPNPANTFLNVPFWSSAGGGNVTLSNASGQMVIQESFISNDLGYIQLNTSALSEGFYLLTITQGDKKLTSKISITR